MKNQKITEWWDGATLLPDLLTRIVNDGNKIIHVIPTLYTLERNIFGQNVQLLVKAIIIYEEPDKK
jgi:hypothetical protein